MTGKSTLLILAILLLCIAIPTHADTGQMEKDFASPPPSARPWVYWFWLNGNITKEGITADLEAMKRVGIGGVLIMEVDQGAPLGPVAFMSAEWRELFKHVDSEAKRLGIEVNMNNDAGWNGSGGPWIKPEQSMKKAVWTETEVEGPKRFEADLARPETIAGFYRDTAVVAFPSAGSYRIPGIAQKAGAWGGPINPGVGGSAADSLASENIIPRDKITDISANMNADGRLAWDVPPGKWTIMRFGYTSTGAQNGPAHDSGRGLDCDKLSKEGVEANFAGMMAKLAEDTRSAGGLTRMPTETSALHGLVATHIDSWEVGSQNWTDRMREEFANRRGYDPTPFLPALSGRVIGSLEISERFLWDIRRTVSELVVENYAAHMRKLAHDHGMRFTCEAYGSPCDHLPYGGEADEPMGEFWTPGGAMETCKGMASAGHIYGKPIIGAEAFTAGDHERWREHPASLKALGDQAFCEGINRFVFHRYAMQPWTPERRPGMTMGPWGQHYERTNTWWEQTPAWHEYLSRCQYMLRQGLYVADICYLQSEAPPQGFRGLARNGYEWDECPAEAVMDRMWVKDGRILLPDGMTYRLLVLPDSRVMTPRLLGKIRELVDVGATVVGPPPERSPSLRDYPACDLEVKGLAQSLWGKCDGKDITRNRYIEGQVFWGVPPEKVLEQMGVPRDFSSRENLRYIHRTTGDADIYFVANPRSHAVSATCAFRVTGRVPELWWPETGRIERAAVYEAKKDVTNVLLPLGPTGSVFVVFRKPDVKPDPVTAILHNGRKVLLATPEHTPKIIVKKAVYGILDDPKRTRDMRTKVQQMVDSGRSIFQVAELAAGDDPAYGIVKTAVIDYIADGKPLKATGTDPETIDLALPARPAPPCELRANGSRLTLTAWQSGTFTVSRGSGKKAEVAVPVLPKPLGIGGPWHVSFPPNSGAPERIDLDRLTSWTDLPDAGAKYFSGTATYRTTFDVPKDFTAKNRTTLLDLGDVQVIAQVKLNDRDLGTLWRRPFTVDITKALKPGRNELEIRVTNLLINRMIGDEQLPEDSDRNGNGTLKSWPQWLQDGQPSPTGRLTFTSWRLWKKADPLLPSGLLGPVEIKAGYQAEVR